MASQSDKYTTGTKLQNQVMLVKQDPSNIVGAPSAHCRASMTGPGIFKPTVVFTEAIGKLMAGDEEHFRIGERCALRLFIDNFVLHAYLDRIRDDIKSGFGEPVGTGRTRRSSANDDNVVTVIGNRGGSLKHGLHLMSRSALVGHEGAMEVVEIKTVDQYLPVLGLIILGVLFAAGSFVASGLLAPRKKATAAKVAPYECGIVADVEPPQRFPVRFYLVAMIFIIFDIEVVFLYPFAVVFRQLGAFGLVEILVFSVVVFASLVFLVSNGALTWGPVKRLTKGMPSRSSDSTIARITADSASDQAE